MSQDITNLGPQDPMITFLERVMRDPVFPIEKAQAAMQLAVEQQKRVAERAFVFDLNAMQMELTQITRDRHNPAFHSKYATEAAIDAAARPVYTKYGFSITYGTAPAIVPGNIAITCTVAHRSGFAETHSLEAPAVPANRGVTQLQAVGGTVTYLKRTLVKMVLALVTADNPEDNDGNGIVEPPAKSEPNYAEIVAMFETAAARIKDSDEARKLMEWKPGVIALTALPHGDERQRYMMLRSKVMADWMTKDDGSSASEDIEGL